MEVITVTNENFQELINREQITVIDFWAPWCGPCMMMGPVLEEFANAHDDVTVGKVNVDENGDLARQFRVMNIPTLAVFQNGELIKKEVGFHQLSELEAIIAG